MRKITLDATTRFSDTIEYYAKYRPRYPERVIQLLKNECKLSPGRLIADIGSGTGIFTQLLLEHQYNVWAVEPNREMSLQAEAELAVYPKFTSVNGTAEATTLPNNSVDGITSAMAFHWFEIPKAKVEFKRILKPGGKCLLIWNFRDSSASRFMMAYNHLLIQYGIDYQKVAAENIQEEDIQQFFYPQTYKIAIFPNQQIMDMEGFKGRLLSTSYIPKANHPSYEKMIQAAEEIFKQYQQEGKVKFIYKTTCYYGVL